MWGGLVAAIALVYLVLWAPAYEGRARLRSTLPAMQLQLAQMTAQANEARSLAGGGQGVTPTGGALRDAAAKSPADNNMPPAQAQGVGAGVQIQLKNAAFPEWAGGVRSGRERFRGAGRGAGGP